MANEYLQRTPTSTGNTRVWTWSGWLKLNDTAAAPTNIFMARTIAGGSDFTYIDSNAGEIRFADDATYANNTTRKIRDSSGWFHLVCNLNTTSSSGDDRMNIYINGVLESNLSSSSNPVINYQATVNTIILHTIGNNANSQYGEYNIADVFFVDGQALTPDVFGFYKQGKGYISVGSTQATDFRPGQWVPKTPRVIKTEINRRGGFGVNGFYLPMNDSKNFGADFHCDPNSIITLNEKLPQPRVGVATTASVGLGYTDALRADPYSANLVLALPFVSGGLSSGFGDYAPSIKGSGSAKTVTINGSVSIASTAGYYGSSSNFGAAGALNYLQVSASSDFAYSSGNFTIETWWFPTSTTRQAIYHGSWGADYSIGIDYNGASSNLKLGMWASSNGSSWNLLNADAGGNGITAGTPVQNQWNHIAYVRNGSTFSMYLNGVCVGTVTGITAAVDVTASDTQVIGEWWNTSAMNSISGYLQDLRIYKGVAKYTGGFDVPRPYTPVGIATWRAVPDTTANNFATWNAVDRVITNGLTLSDGNLSITNGASYRAIRSTVGIPTTGKWYYEHRESTARLTNLIGSVGIATNGHAWDQNSYYDSFSGFYWGSSGLQLPINGTGTGQWISSPGIGNGDILNIAYDANSRNLWLGINGTYYTRSGNTMTGNGNPSTGVNPTGTISTTYSNLGLFPFNNAYSTTSQTNFGQNPTFSGNTTAGTFTDTNGKGLFKYQPPSGFLALCEDNLPTPAISDPGRHFKTVLWTGDGNSGRSIVGVGFTPDLVWIKSRGPSAYNHRAFDSVRGAGKDNFLMPNSTAVEGASSDYYGGISSFNADGFSMVYGTGGSNIGINESGTNFVAWCWKAGAGTTSTNTNGSITSVVSVNQDAGFSIVSYTGNGVSNATVGHGLGKVPAFGVVKCRDTNSASNEWRAQHKGLTSGNYIVLSSTAAQQTISSTSFGSLGTFTSSSTVTLQAGSSDSTTTNESGKRYIAYCWAEIEGYSKFGSYVGNGSADGPFVYCGFKPAWVMIKSSSNTENWFILDSSRNSTNTGDMYYLYSNLSNIEGGGVEINFLSNGFKVRYTGSMNNSGYTYIFAAFAESPFQTANSK